VFYAKSDGSLNATGWELVTHPIAPQFWTAKKMEGKNPVGRVLKLVKQLKDMDYTSYDNGRCGLHVHVSRTAFGKNGNRSLKNSRFYWFSRLVNGKLFAKLSQREQSKIDQWAKQKEVKVKTLVPRSFDTRYVAVNVTKQTVEVRIFRGNMREDRVRKAVEAVIAAVEFAGTISSKHWKRDLEEMFAGWVSRNGDRFPNLKRYLFDIGVLVRREDNATAARTWVGELVEV